MHRDSQIGPAPGAVLAQGEAIVPLRLVLGAGFGQGEQGGPEVLTWAPAGEALALAEAVEDAFRRYLRPVDTYRVDGPVGALDSGSRPSSIDLDTDPVFPEVLLTTLPVTGLEVRAGPLVERNDSAAIRSRASTAAAPARRARVLLSVACRHALVVIGSAHISCPEGDRWAPLGPRQGGSVGRGLGPPARGQSGVAPAAG